MQKILLNRVLKIEQLKSRSKKSTNSDKGSELSRTRYGTTDPERVENRLWDKAVEKEWNGWAMREHLGVTDLVFAEFSHSSYRDVDPGPFWSWERFGRSTTSLPDGRTIHIAGEHEDHYDVDFCIYNDVVVEYPDGSREFYLYPKAAFPPTDNHTATLVDHEIILIGSLGYRDLRRPGETQVLKLDTQTLRFEHVATSGDNPGWISSHITEKLDDRLLLVVGGQVETGGNLVDNHSLFQLDLESLTWSRRDHGDTTIFPVAESEYLAHKNPKFGTANPERSNNPFWLAMARAGWSPSRARLHFADPAPERSRREMLDDNMADFSKAKLARAREEVVWTAVREDALTVELGDGRTVLIGGKIVHYGDEYADPWNYNDVVVSKPDGDIDIFTYPVELFPRTFELVGGPIDERIVVVGRIDPTHHPERDRDIVFLALDSRTFAIEKLTLPEPPVPISVFGGRHDAEGKRLLFWNESHSVGDPELCVPLDLATLAWGDAFPEAHWYDDDEDN